jgi:hypothetical protein
MNFRCLLSRLTFLMETRLKADTFESGWVRKLTGKPVAPAPRIASSVLAASIEVETTMQPSFLALARARSFAPIRMCCAETWRLRPVWLCARLAKAGR